MNQKGGISLPILIGLVVISLVLATGAFYLYQQEHTKNIQLQDQIDELNTKQRFTEAKLGETKQLVAESQLKLQEAKAQIETLTNELAQEKSARLEGSNKLDQISADLEQQKVLRQDLENRLSQSESDGKKIKEQIKVMTQEKMDLEAQIKNLESGASGVELGKVVVNSDKTPVNASTKKSTKSKTVVAPQAKAAQVKPLEGKISVVNKEYNFVVINLGSKDGVSLADEFTVTRAGKTIGNIKIEKVHESMSAAGFGSELKNSIRENDVVQKVR